MTFATRSWRSFDWTRHSVVSNPNSQLAAEHCGMGFLLAFAPFIAFAVIDRLVGSTEGLVVGALRFPCSHRPRRDDAETLSQDPGNRYGRPVRRPCHLRAGRQTHLDCHRRATVRRCGPACDRPRHDGDRPPVHPAVCARASWRRASDQPGVHPDQLCHQRRLGAGLRHHGRGGMGVAIFASCVSSCRCLGDHRCACRSGEVHGMVSPTLSEKGPGLRRKASWL